MVKEKSFAPFSFTSLHLIFYITLLSAGSEARLAPLRFPPRAKYSWLNRLGRQTFVAFGPVFPPIYHEYVNL